ncbi:MAG: 3'-5' exonuclease [Opitutales bacterium]|nr:3'-5' exonuclease [Opitutales bacterium]
MSIHPVHEAYTAHFEPTWDEALGWENARFVVLDTESTGFDPKRDRIVSVGAIGVMYFELLLDDTFDVFMPISHNTSSVTLHGITREYSERGMPEEPALCAFLDYLGDGVIVGHHIRHDVAILNAAITTHFGFELRNMCVDTMDLTLRLADMGLLDRDQAHEDYTLDGLARLFRIRPADRHTAAGDAFITGQIFLKLLRLAERAGFLRLGQLTEPYDAAE